MEEEGEQEEEEEEEEEGEGEESEASTSGSKFFLLNIILFLTVYQGKGNWLPRPQSNPRR